MKNKKIGLIVGGIVVLIAVFYAGMSYGKSQVSVGIRQAGQGFNMMGGLGGRGTRTGGEFIAGQIISKDANSITIQLMSGITGQSGSKIIFLDSNTKITKSVDGTIADLNAGGEVSITGTPNADGSINAQSVQIRPNIPTPVVK